LGSLLLGLHLPAQTIIVLAAIPAVLAALLILNVKTPSHNATPVGQHVYPSDQPPALKGEAPL
jgi:AAHS family 4-hydroxybenzoate transporter-like MFS transporter